MRKIVFVLFLVHVIYACSVRSKYVSNQGSVYGTFYHITYESPNGDDLQEGIELEMDKLNRSLSTFDTASVISKVNRNESVVLDDYFITVFRRAIEISESTNGAFDITVAPMVNVWGFGFKNKEQVTPGLIDSLKMITGYWKVQLANGKIIKEHAKTMLDCSAIAKGYACDVVANYLKEKGCKNYMVEIGGEVVAFGDNAKGKPWSIGISNPNDDEPIFNQSLKAIVQLPRRAMATSGNYRNFYIEGGKKYAHTIDPHTGYPVQHSLLSSTVLADNCMTADAYATAFMVMGLEKSIELANGIDEIEVYFIYSDEQGNYKTYASDGFKSLLVREN